MYFTCCSVCRKRKADRKLKGKHVCRICRPIGVRR